METPFSLSSLGLTLILSSLGCTPAIILFDELNFRNVILGRGLPAALHSKIASLPTGTEMFFKSNILGFIMTVTRTLCSAFPALLLAIHLKSVLSSRATLVMVNTPVISFTINRSLAAAKFCFVEPFNQVYTGAGLPLALHVILADSPSTTSKLLGILSEIVGFVWTSTLILFSCNCPVSSTSALQM
uniref:Secreted protein n=1 Tax=Panstrongylus lignarius TaxID=156445 RepID=A0A224XZ04_9HEMI